MSLAVQIDSEDDNEDVRVGVRSREAALTFTEKEARTLSLGSLYLDEDRCGVLHTDVIARVISRHFADRGGRVVCLKGLKRNLPRIGLDELADRRTGIQSPSRYLTP